MGLRCVLKSHEWSGCKCARCGTMRHDWSEDCEKCITCGAIRQGSHEWRGCKCLVCGEVRDEVHDWSKDCQKCAICGTSRKAFHLWSNEGKKCSICGKGVLDFRGCPVFKCTLHKPTNDIMSRMRATADALDPESVAVFFEHVEANLSWKKIPVPGGGQYTYDLDGQAEVICRDIRDAPGLVHCRNSHGMTALHLAARGGETSLSRPNVLHRKLAAVLLAHGADVNAVDSSGNTALRYAACHSWDSGRLVDLLMEQGGLDLRGDIEAWARNGDAPQIQTILETSERAREETLSSSALHIAAICGRQNVADLLLSHGANINLRDGHGFTPLHYAAGNGRAELLTFLLARGADVSAKDPEGYTARKHVPHGEDLLDPDEVSAHGLMRLRDKSKHLLKELVDPFSKYGG
jgi:hypothetical protein